MRVFVEIALRLVYGNDVWFFSKIITDQRMIYYHYYHRIVSGSQKKPVKIAFVPDTHVPSSSHRPGGCCCCMITPVVADDSPPTRKQHKFIPRKNNEKLIKLPFIFICVLRNAFPTGKWHRDFSSAQSTVWLTVGRWFCDVNVPCKNYWIFFMFQKKALKKFWICIYWI